MDCSDDTRYVQTVYKVPSQLNLHSQIIASWSQLLAKTNHQVSQNLRHLLDVFYSLMWHMSRIEGRIVIVSLTRQWNTVVTALPLAIWVVCVITCFGCFLFFVWIRWECYKGHTALFPLLLPSKPLPASSCTVPTDIRRPTMIGQVIGTRTSTRPLVTDGPCGCPPTGRQSASALRHRGRADDRPRCIIAYMVGWPYFSIHLPCRFHFLITLQSLEAAICPSKHYNWTKPRRLLTHMDTLGDTG